MDKQTAETIVKVFSVLGFVGGGLEVILGLLLAVFGSVGAGMLFGLRMMLPMALFGGLFIALAIFEIILGAVSIFVSWNLWRFKKWARILVGVGGILSLFAFPIGTVLGIFMIYFFLINKDIAKVCSK